MRSFKKKILFFLFALTMMSPVLPIYAINLIDGVPEEVATKSEYIRVPVYYQGKEVEVFQSYLRKYKDTGNENEKFDISGTATFKIEAYAYVTGDQVKIGSYIQCWGENDKWYELDWQDRDGIISLADFQKVKNGTMPLSLTIEKITFVMENENETDKRANFTIRASNGGDFGRGTNGNITFGMVNTAQLMDNSANKIVPESLSHLQFDVQYNEDSQDIQYSINIKPINDAVNVYGKKVVALDGTNPIVYIKNGGTVIPKEKYTIDLVNSTVNNTIIKFASGYTVPAGSTLSITVYYPTKMGNEIKYSQYLSNFSNVGATVSVNVGEEHKEKYVKKVDGQPDQIIYRTVPGTNTTINMTYAEIPTTN